MVYPRSPSQSPSTTLQAMARRKTLLQAREGSVVSDHVDNNNKAEPNVGFRRTLTAVDLVLYGVGSSIGAGIYVLVGLGAQIAGPAISLSFLLCGMACILTSLAYAEFASRIPVAGSAFTYVYVAFGEFFAWLVGWNLILGYGFTTSVVARAWADYTGDFFVKLANAQQQKQSYSSETLRVITAWLERLTEWRLFNDEEDSYSFSLLSIFIVIVNTWILLRGVKDSSRFNNVMTVLNVSVLTLVVLAGLFTQSVNVENLIPFAPHNVTGVLEGSGLVFFAFIGFDMVASLSEEVVNPEVNMPIGIVGSLVASTFIYVAVAFVVVGMAPQQFLSKTNVPIINALLINACCTHEDQVSLTTSQLCLTCTDYIKPILAFASQVVAVGAILGLMASSFASFMGQPRIFYRMAQDGLWFRRFGDLCPVTQVPRAGIIITGIGTAFLACFVPLDALANLISLGTLMVFTFVDAGVILLRCRAIAAAPAPPNNTALRSSRKQWSKRMVYLLILYTGALLGASMVLANMNATQHPLAFKFLVLLFGSVAVATAAVITFLPDTWSQPPEQQQQVGRGDGRQQPLPVSFMCPFVPAIPLAGVACNSFMMGSLPLSSWLLIVIWLSLGIAVYFAYGIHHSELGKMLSQGELAPLLASNVIPAHENAAVQGYENLRLSLRMLKQDSTIQDNSDSGGANETTRLVV